MTQEPVTESLDAFSTQHAHLIAWVYTEANCARWGLSLEKMAEGLCRSVRKRFPGERPAAPEVEAYVKSLHLHDLALACACSEGLDAAWEFFVGNYRQQLYGVARAILQGAREFDAVNAQELADSLYAELYGINSAKSGRRKSLFEYFHGRSKLSTWLRALLAQRHVDQLRARTRMGSLDAEEDGPGLASTQGATPPPPDPDRPLYLGFLDAALSVAITTLPPRDRMLLSCYYLDQLTLREIGQTLGEHESTISRQLDRVRRQLRETVADSLLRGEPARDGQAARPGLDQTQVQLAFKCALDDWPFDLSKALSKGSTGVDAKG